MSHWEFWEDGLKEDNIGRLEHQTGSHKDPNEK
jgi:hypothetical protein